MAKRIDSHQHFWKYKPDEYAWIGPEMAALQRDFLPEHLYPLMRALAIEQTVAVQAQQSVRETEWLLELASQNDWIAGVVGWVPLAEPGCITQIAHLAANPKLKGLRHVLQDEPDENYMLRTDFNEGVAEIRKFQLVYDILVFEHHLPQTTAFVDRHPDQVFVLDHIAKPRIRSNSLQPWAKQIASLAKRPNVYCKLSGMVTEADWGTWSAEQLKIYFDTVLEVFTPRRVMFGSDWPVMLVACSYEKWLAVVDQYVSQLTSQEQARIWGETAAEVYHLL